MKTCLLGDKQVVQKIANNHYGVFKSDVIVNWKKPTLEDIKNCMCSGCKMMFPIIAITPDIDNLPLALLNVVNQGCELHNNNR